jgi:hypothetical protein
MEDSPTIRTMPMEAGMILGTAAYVSPEQARGKPVDRRADIWAFGVVLYEMLTGRQLFGRDTISDTLAAVLKEEPQWDHVPIKVRRLLRSCLQKNPDHRLRDIGDAPLLLEDVPRTISTRRPWFAWASSVVLLAVVAPLAFVHFRETSPAPADPVRFEVQLPGATDPPSFAISPDGRRLAFVATGTDGLKRLWIRALNAIQANPIPGSETSRSGIRHVPFWSPDSRYVAFDAGGKLKKVDVVTGSVHTVCSVPGDIAGGSWNKHDVIIFGIDAPGHGIMRVSAASGEPEVVIGNADSARPGVRFLFPTFLPDGKHFLYRRNGPPDGIYVGSLEAKPQQQADTPLVRSDAGFFSYVSLPNSRPGQLLFTREGTLLGAAQK